MIPLLKKLFTDETCFVGYARAALLGLGGASVAGMLPEYVPHWLGVVSIAAGGFLRAGEKNMNPSGGDK